jgi:hypothetical protein
MHKVTPGATIRVTGKRLTALLGLPFRYCDMKVSRFRKAKPTSTDFDINNLSKAITFDGNTITFLDTTDEGLAAIDTLIGRLRMSGSYRHDDPLFKTAKELATVIHTIATEAYPGFDDLVFAYYDVLPDVDEEEEEDEE